jgi:ABC-type transport system involved in Fe-S cluster assembly fused permease/ATPase subunit
MEGRTAIVAHRRAVSGMDRLIVLDRGRVVGEGSVGSCPRGGGCKAVAAAVGWVPGE